MLPHGLHSKIFYLAADPFSPANNSGNDLMAAFGGVPNNGTSPAPAPAANPWDLGGLDPVPLMPGTNGAHQVKHFLNNKYLRLQLKYITQLL